MSKYVFSKGTKVSTLREVKIDICRFKPGLKGEVVDTIRSYDRCYGTVLLYLVDFDVEVVKDVVRVVFSDEFTAVELEKS